MTRSVLLLGTALTMLSMTAANAATITFNESQLAGGSGNADQTSVTVSSGGLGLTASTDPSGDGRVRTFQVGTPQGGLWFGATVGNNFGDPINNATAPSDAVYSISFDQAVTSISLSFDYLTDNVTRPQPELLSEFATELGSATIVTSGLFDVFHNTATNSVIADRSQPGSTAGQGTISFDSGGLAFNTFSFRHQQTPEQIGFTVNTVIVDVAAVPLPAALPMLLAGLGGLGLMRRRAKA